MANRKVENILKEIDFEKIHRYMEQTNWKWVTDTPYELEVPSVGEIRRRVEMRVTEALAHKGDMVMSSGGFWIIKQGRGIAVLFSIESYDHL